MLHIECLLNPTLDPEEGRISGRGIEEGLQELRIPDTYEQNSKNWLPLDILVCNSANNLFKIQEKAFLPNAPLAELQARTSRCCIFLLFLPYKYQVSLR